MKTLPGLKILLFFSLVFAVALAVYAGPKQTKLWNKKHKLLVGFGWSETDPNDFNPVPHSIDQIKAYLTGTNAPVRYKLQHYADGKPDGNPDGDLNVCLPAPAAAPTPTPTATSNPSGPQSGPSGTPSGAKTQSVGLVQFNDPTVANDFVEWVNSTATAPAKASAKSKKNK